MRPTQRIAIEIGSHRTPDPTSPGAWQYLRANGAARPTRLDLAPCRDMIETFADTVTDTINLADTQLF